MATRIRGQEVTAQLVVDGDLKAGSFSKLENFKLTPRTDLMDSDFVGEKESEPDIQHHGFDFSFTCHEVDQKVWALLDQIVQLEHDGLPHPAVNMVVTYRYRDPAQPTRIVVLQNCVIKLDDSDISSRKDYVKNSFSGKCKTIQQVG